MKSRNSIFNLVLILIIMLFCSSFVFASYTEENIDIQGLKYSSMIAVDFDHNTNLDVMLCGQSGNDETKSQTLLYEIRDGKFIENNIDIVNVTYCSLNWIDVDNDGFDDVVISGESNNQAVMKVYRNNANYQKEFTLYDTLYGKTMSDSVVGDLDNDGDLDLVVIGCNNSIAEDNLLECDDFSSDVYINNGTHLKFNSTWSDSLEDVWQGSLALGDYDNDNDLDLALSGCNANSCSYASAVTYIYNNTGINFTRNDVIEVEGVWWGSIAFEDYGDDGDLDLYISGLNESDKPVTKVYESDQTLYGESTISTPSISLFNFDKNTNLFNIGWNDLGLGIYYSLKLGSQENLGDIVSGIYARSSNPTQGYFGNMMTKSEINFSLPNQCLHGKVKAINSSMLESAWGANVIWNDTEVCDGYDNDCDNLIENDVTNINEDKSSFVVGVTRIDEDWDKDGDGYVDQKYKDKLCINLTNTSLNNNGFDCDDNNANAYPGATESDQEPYCGKDFNCDGKSTDCNVGTDQSVTSGGGGGGSTEKVVTPPTKPEENEKVDYRDLVPDVPKPPQVETPSSSASSNDKVEEKVVEDLLSLSLQVQIKPEPVYDGEGNTIVELKVKNNNLFPQNVYLHNTIPKEVAKNTDEMQKVEGYNYDIIEYDPVIGFGFEVDSHREKIFKYKINKELNSEDITQIVSQIVEDKEQQRKLKLAIEDAINKTKDVINLTQQYYIDNEKNQTTFTIDIDIDKTKGLTNVSIFQEIPKCLLEIINEQIVESENRKFEVINDDPLIAWHFDELIDAEQIQYTINAVADENCTNQVKALAVARDIYHSVGGEKINYANVLWAVSIIPIIALIMIIFGILSTKIEHEDEEVQKLVEYIKKHYRHGFKKEALREKLLDAGYEKNIVEECLHLHTKNKFHYWIQRLEIGFNELILVVLIGLNVFDFLEILPGDIDYFKKIISWVMLAYLLYKGSITKILFGTKNKLIDVTLIISFFSLTLKNLVGFAQVAVTEVDKVADLYLYLINNNVVFGQYVFIGGLIALIVLSFIIAIYLPIKNPSFIAALHMKEGHHKGLAMLWKAFVVHILLAGFFIVVFNLMMEWLAIAVDALILVITLIVMVFLLIKHHKKFTAGKFMEETSDTAEKFYEKFIDLFHYKKTIYLGFSGMLILHALTEVGSFIIPYILGIRDSVYFGNAIFVVGHNPLFFSSIEHIEPLFHLQTAGLSELLKFQVGYTYVMNVIAILALFVLPAIVWYNYFKNKDLPIMEIPAISFGKNRFMKSLTSGILLSSFFMFFVRPVFELKAFLGGDDLIGVDILTQEIMMKNLGFVCILSLIIAIISFIVIYFKKEVAHYVILPISFVFFSNYIYQFAKSTFNFNLNQFSILMNINLFMSFYAILFGLLAVVVLYGIGFIINTYLYVPHWFKEIMREIPLIKFLFVKHDNHHIHHYDNHDNRKHMEKELALKEYILKSLDSGHELFYAVEHLVENGWPISMIEEAVDLVKHDRLYKEDIHHISHYHHNKKKIHELSNWILDSYGKNDFTQIIDTAEKAGWSDDDLILAVRCLKGKLKFNEKDQEILKYMRIMH